MQKQIKKGDPMEKRILYAEANYAAMVRDNGYFVDKTEYIAKLERVNNPVFLRPRRFGKSLFKKLQCSINDFPLKNEDLVQIEGYVEGVKREYPEAKISTHVIYCFGNMGCKVFDIA